MPPDDRDRRQHREERAAEHVDREDRPREAGRTGPGTPRQGVAQQGADRAAHRDRGDHQGRSQGVRRSSPHGGFDRGASRATASAASPSAWRVNSPRYQVRRASCCAVRLEGQQPLLAAEHVGLLEQLAQPAHRRARASPGRRYSRSTRLLPGRDRRVEPVDADGLPALLLDLQGELGQLAARAGSRGRG